MIEANLVFRDEAGDIANVSNLSFKVFMEKWANGELRRDLDVKVTDPGNAVQLSGELWIAFLDLHHQLSLADKLLVYKEVESDEPRLSIYPEGEHQYLFPSLYIVASTSEGRAAQEGVQDVVYNTLCQLLREITNRDNAGVLYLLHQSSQTKDVIAFNQFTVNAFCHLRNEIWKWALPVTTCVGTAKAFSRIDTEEDWFCKLDSASMPRFGGVELLCVGGPHDFIYPMEDEFADLFMCSTPQHLGVRCVKEPLSLQQPVSDPAACTASMTIATAILSNKAVQAGVFV
jgi:hypothetical protein